MTREAVFVRIPKNATTSIERALSRYPQVLLNSEVDLLPRDKYPDEWSRRGLSVLWMEALGKERWDRAFTFTFTRNPYDRAVSSYRHTCRLLRKQSPGAAALRVTEWVRRAKNVPSPSTIARWIAGKLSFAEFLEMVEADVLPLPGARWHSTLQWRHVTDDDGRVLVNFVGKFESLEEDFNRLCDQIGIARMVLPTLNASRSGHTSYRDHYSSELMDAVRRIYRRDFQLFGYEMDSLGPAPPDSL